MKVREFSGFDSASFGFMRSLAENNNTLWFDRHRGEWEHAREQLRALCGALAPFVHDLDPELETEPRTGRCMGRINRDTRFAADKRPYRESVDLLFFPRSFGRTGAPGLAVGITPTESYIGTWLGASMKRWRERYEANIRARHGVFERYLESNSNFSDFWIRSESYKRTRIANLPPLAHEWAQRKFYYMGDRVDAGEVVRKGAGFLETVQRTFVRLYPLYLFASSQSIAADLERFRRRYRDYHGPGAGRSAK